MTVASLAPSLSAHPSHPSGSLLKILRLAVIAFALLLNACSTLPPAENRGTTALAAPEHLDGFTIYGRFSLTHEGKNHVGRVNWRHDGPHDVLILSSPLGQALAEVVSGPSGARMTQADGHVLVADNAEQLLETLLGYPLPLDKLVVWLRGVNRGINRSGDALTYDASGRVLSRQDQAWRIDYEYDDDHAQSLPARLFIDRADGLRLRLRIEQWETPPSRPVGP
ncbi:MAG TPA: lipoprotein insertase outer membrane protein LolB [Accumulibacter sp.]|nr:lipoprotein insertase outer membrane protein LolB [Accumulibacter sp.]